MDPRQINDLPPPVLASPGQVDPPPQSDLRWWRPGLREAAAHLGWRWLQAVPALLIVPLLIAAFFHPALLRLFWWVGIKWTIIALALPVLLVADLMRRATIARREPFCIHCGYDLSGLGEQGRCPECGAGYTRQLIEEYRRNPNWFIQRYHAHGQLPTAPAPFDAGPVRSRKRSRDGT